MSEKIRNIEDVRKASLVLGENYFKRNPKMDEFRIRDYGDIMDKANDHANWAEEQGYIEVKRDAEGRPAEVIYTPKYFAEKIANRNRGADAVKIHLRKMGEKYYGRRRANPESVAMDKIENFQSFLEEWLDDEEMVSGWNLRQMKKESLSVDSPSSYRLEVVFADDNKSRVFIGEPEKLVALIDNELKRYYPDTAVEYI